MFMMKKILLIDDEPDFCQMLKINLESEGRYAVDAISEPRAGIEKIKNERFDILLLDVLMPTMSGYHVLEEIKRSIPVRKMPAVIILSAKQNMAEIFHSTDVNGFLNKPFSTAELIEKIEALAPEFHRRHAAKLDTGNKPEVLIAGVDEYVLKKMRDYLEEAGFTVLRGLDEHDTVLKAEEREPLFILCQFWEEPGKFDLAKALHELKKTGWCDSIPFYAFCTEGNAVETMKILPREKILSYRESQDLLKKLDKIIAVHKR